MISFLLPLHEEEERDEEREHTITEEFIDDGLISLRYAGSGGGFTEGQRDFWFGEDAIREGRVDEKK
jgi:hypothetical protein